MRKQQCTECERPSLPGLKRGHGKCDYHWAKGVWGEKHADRVAASRLRTTLKNIR